MLSCTGNPQQELNFKIAVVDDGIYRIDFAALGISVPSLASSSLTLTERGQPVALAMDDGGNGLFEPGESFTFLGKHLQGEHSWFNSWSPENIYVLRAGGSDSRSIPESGLTPPRSVEEEGLAGKTLTQHFEQEEFRVALAESADEQTENWYWKRLTHLDKQPFQLQLPAGVEPIAIRVALAGLSMDRAATKSGEPHHRVELLLNGTGIASKDWNGQAAVEISADEAAVAKVLTDAPTDAPTDALMHAKGQNAEDQTIRLELRVPKRYSPGEPDAVIDVVLLNWIEIDSRPTTFSDIVTYSGPDGKRLYLADKLSRAPGWIKQIHHRGLRSDSRQTDYLMIAHGSLLEAIEPLAEFHRQQGLSVSVVDVADIYNEFNDGIVSPFAIRDFIKYASENRAAPAVRYVLLVGDASWDVRSEAGRQRNLLPSMQVQAYDELAASDNGFVSIHGDDWRPDLAIGRIPAANAAELTAVVQKLLAYAKAPAGQWRQHMALVSDMNSDFQTISSQLAAGLVEQGFKVETIYPDEAADSTKQDQSDLVNAINEGQSLVHFLGHGGRFVWRTGPLDYHNSSDLFSLPDLERLDNQGRLPLVLSMTCSTGPFDHPQAGSIAEAFLMLPQGGAAGVLAASWRVPASQTFSALLLQELTQPGQSVGEAILKAKQKETRRALVESYNFLGDPALVLRISDNHPKP
ncbi:MAG: C25 family cysteine peptidase [Xanthomonadales bacterium]|nr:C25 family cysteine peptidase [Xanthomonadales bacterium]